MFNRPLLLVGLLAAAVAVPYLIMDENIAATAKARLGRFRGPAAPAKTAEPLADLAALGPGVPLPTFVPLEEAIRFDLSPEWITARWPQVTAVAGDTKHLGLRVAYVSGTQPNDVAGSLTYYFDEGHQLQRIMLSGLTGDAARLVAIASGQCGLEPARTLEAGLYVAGDPAQPTSLLRISHLPVVRIDATQARMEVALDLQRSDVNATRASQSKARPARIPLEAYRRW